MARYRLDFYRKSNVGVSFPTPIFFRSQFIKAKNIKGVTDIVHILGNYGVANHESDFNYESEDMAIMVLKFNEKKEMYL
jgi:hypothetical protein